MKELLALLALLCIIGTASKAQTRTSDQVPIDFYIYEYSTVHLRNAIHIEIHSGTSSSSGSTEYVASANFPALLVPSLDIMPDAPGHWSCSIDGGTDRLNFGPGDRSGSVQVFVDHLPPAQPEGSYFIGYLVLNLMESP